MTATFSHDAPGTSVEAWRSRPEWAQVPRLTMTGAQGEPCTRLVVLAAHPDDESLGAGGLLAQAHVAGIEVHLVLVTAGERSHPRSPTVTVDRLAAIRIEEAQAALAVVAPGATSTLVGIADGEVESAVDDLVRTLVGIVGDGRHVLIVAPWREDGHRDHDSTGRAAAIAAHRTGARCLGYPIWSWHWRAAGDLPWADVRSLELTGSSRSAKALAIAEHRSQVGALSAHAGDEVLLSADLLSHFSTATETFIEMEPCDPSFDDLHEALDDPWGVETRWYEERKRQLLLSMLPRRRFAHAWEAGCSTGALAVALAARADRVVASDLSLRALRRARGRPQPHGPGGIRWLHQEVTRRWPSDEFDLIVVSEVGYFLSPRDLDLFIQVVSDACTQDGVVVLCHWRHEIVGFPLDGEQVHRGFLDSSAWREVARYADADVEILVLGSKDTMPVASR